MQSIFFEVFSTGAAVLVEILMERIEHVVTNRHEFEYRYVNINRTIWKFWTFSTVMLVLK